MAMAALAALAANVTSMWLLARHRSGGGHMKASWICTQTDVIANLGVTAAALMVYYSSLQCQTSSLRLPSRSSC